MGFPNGLRIASFRMGFLYCVSNGKSFMGSLPFCDRRGKGVALIGASTPLSVDNLTFGFFFELFYDVFGWFECMSVDVHMYLYVKMY